MSVRVVTEPFDPATEHAAFIASAAGAGAAVIFTGLVRSTPEEPITALTLECYVVLALAQLERIEAQAITRFGLLDARIIHRYGRMLPGEPIVQVMTLAEGRQDAFAAAEFLMDYLKTDAPFWKKEETNSGARWVESKARDEAAKERWR